MAVKNWNGIRFVAFISILAICLIATLALLAGHSSAAALGPTAQTISTGKGAAPDACGAIGFATPVPYNTGGGPTGVVVGDFNGDGKRDLAISNYADSRISVLLGNGNGTFQPQTYYPAGQLPFAVVTGDFNGDGKLDLATAPQTDNVVSVLLGNGNGTFQARTTQATDTNPLGIVTGDFNGDGKLDIATANYGSGEASQGNVSMLLGNGNGTFHAKTTTATGISSVDLAAGDLNGDSKLDLVVSNRGDNTMSVLLGNGNGTFLPQATYAVSDAPSGVKLADLNGDGKLDVAVVDRDINSVSVLLNNGDGTFLPHTEFDVDSQPNNLVVADFDGDGKSDIIAADTDGSLSVLKGIGDGTFEPDVRLYVGVDYSNLAASDFNGDGSLDLAVDSNNFINTVSILLNNCTGGGSTATPTTRPTQTPVGTATPTTIPGDFADVPPSSPFYSYVHTLTSHGAVGGYACGGAGEPCDANHDAYYRPGANVTRGQLSKIIALAAGLDSVIPPTQQTFHDVPPNNTFHLYIEQLAQTGAIAGYPCNSSTLPCDSANRPWFLPGNNATRGQISKIVSIAAGFSETIPASQQSFTDVPHSNTFWLYIERLYTRGIIGGYNDAGHCTAGGAPCFLPNANTTRGQMAKIGAIAFYPDAQKPSVRK